VSSNTTTTLLTSTNAALVGQPVTLTARVATSPLGPVVPVGVVKFLDGSTTLGTANLDSTGTATLTTGSLQSGNRNLTAVFVGNNTFIGSTSSPVAETIANEVTSQFKITRGAIRRRGRGPHFVQTDKLKNTGAPVIGPIALVLDGLSPGAMLTRATGVTTSVHPGSPYILVLGDSVLGRGKRIPVRLDFSAHSRRIRYTPHLFTGISNP